MHEQQQQQINKTPQTELGHTTQKIQEMQKAEENVNQNVSPPQQIKSGVIHRQQQQQINNNQFFPQQQAQQSQFMQSQTQQPPFQLIQLQQQPQYQLYQQSQPHHFNNTTPSPTFLTLAHPQILTK